MQILRKCLDWLLLIEMRDFQRILWRASPQNPIREYRLITVTYGTASASFLSFRSLHQLAFDGRYEYPLASAAILKEFYVDDRLSGGNNEGEVVELVDQLNLLMQQGGFKLRKWLSNIPRVLKNIPKECCKDIDSLSLDNEDGIKILNQGEPKR